MIVAALGSAAAAGKTFELRRSEAADARGRAMGTREWARLFLRLADGEQGAGGAQGRWRLCAGAGRPAAWRLAAERPAAGGVESGACKAALLSAAGPAARTPFPPPLTQTKLAGGQASRRSPRSHCRPCRPFRRRPPAPGAPAADAAHPHEPACCLRGSCSHYCVRARGWRLGPPKPSPPRHCAWPRSPSLRPPCEQARAQDLPGRGRGGQPGADGPKAVTPARPSLPHSANAHPNHNPTQQA